MYPLFDAHCDTITEIFKNGEELFRNRRHVSIAKLLAFASPVQTFAVWTGKKSGRDFFKDAMEVIDFYEAQLKKYSEYIAHANNCGDILKNKSGNKISALLSLEGGEALMGDIGNLETFYERGVRILGLTWNNKNELGCGALGEDGPLSEFGVRVVERMNEIGMLIDVSHLSDNGFKDVSEKSKKPFIASHSNSREVCANKRNLSDGQIIKIAESGGVIGLNLYPPFLSESKQTGVMDAAAHIGHIIKLAGNGCVGLGCDFDGIDKTPAGMTDVTALNKFAYVLEMMYGRETAEKIMYGNFMNVFRAVCG